MKIQIMSDTHLEFDGDNGRKFISDLDPTDVDVLVLAGDIITPNQMYRTLANFCDLYKDTEILYVLGNHDCIHEKMSDIGKILRDLSLVYPNFTWLENEIKEITCLNSKGKSETKRFLGCTLWYSATEDAQLYKNTWFDFRYIKNADPYIFLQNKKSMNFLFKNTKPGDIVITHMLPSDRSVAPKYVGEVTNCYFVCDMTTTIEKKKPLLWIHGHTHNSFDYKFFDTRIVCNPRGYIRSKDLNPLFNPDLIIDTAKEI